MKFFFSLGSVGFRSIIDNAGVSDNATKAEIITDTANAGHGIFVGRNIAYQGQSLNRLNPPGSAFFRGSVDEVFIAAAALSQDQIQRIMRENRLD